MDAQLRFSSVMLIRDGNPYILVSAARAKRLRPDGKRPIPVIIRVNGKPDVPWRINMMPAGDGTFYLYLHGDVRKASGTGVGDRVTVELSFDSSYVNGPMHPMPDWFSEALDANSKAKENWGALIPSRKKEILRYFAALKSPEARARNLERALGALSGEKLRFMARSWERGR